MRCNLGVAVVVMVNNFTKETTNGTEVIEVRFKQNFFKREIFTAGRIRNIKTSYFKQLKIRIMQYYIKKLLNLKAFILKTLDNVLYCVLQISHAHFI